MDKIISKRISLDVSHLIHLQAISPNTQPGNSSITRTFNSKFSTTNLQNATSTFISLPSVRKISRLLNTSCARRDKNKNIIVFFCYDNKMHIFAFQTLCIFKICIYLSRRAHVFFVTPNWLVIPRRKMTYQP